LSITEIRQRELGDQARKPPFSRFRSGSTSQLAITIQVASKLTEAATELGVTEIATQYGHHKISSCLDNQGNTLKQLPSLAGGARADNQYVDIGRENIRFWYGEDSEYRFDIELVFEPAPRSSTHLSTIEGSLKLITIDEQNEIIFDDIVSRTGQALRHQALEAAGLTIKVGDIKRSPEAPYLSIQIEVTGNLDNLIGMKFREAGGEHLNSSFDSSSSGKKTTITVGCLEISNTDVSLTITVGPGQEIEVPLKLTDLPLP